tara:strand:+ start:316 stop:942 length:627 start_codon:yes stop_codon:yes gene_type:complete
MNISKYLLIDVGFVITAITLLFVFQGGKKKSPLFQSSNIEKLLRESSVKFPEKEKLIMLEKLSKDQGSGIKFDSLVGDWKFASVWKKDQDEEDQVFSSLLRVFYANLKIKKKISIEHFPTFPVVASIRFGFFTIEFSGTGYLRGKQPLLPFFLNLIELKSGSNILLSKSIEVPQEEEKSFFGLIAIAKNGTWLSARGHGGAVVIWLRD